MTTAPEWLLAWALSQGAPPELAAALVTSATAPVAPARDALLRAAVSLQVQAAREGNPALEVWSRTVLAMAGALTPAMGRVL